MKSVQLRLEPLSVEIAAPCGASLAAILADRGVEFPCGGAGICGGCAVRMLAGSLPVTDADRTAFTVAQLGQGWRLACQARADASLVLECGQWRMNVLTDTSILSGAGEPGSKPWRGLGIAIDLGTTTIAAQMLDMASGDVLAVETGLNPQAAYGSDVMSRIRAVLEGADLTTPVRDALGEIILRVAGNRIGEITRVILVGNTVMHHLFSALSVEPLAQTPFASPHLGAQSFKAQDLGWTLPEDCIVRFAPCLGGFVGSDILAGILATGMTRGEDLMALVDLGTNGEIAIGNRNGVVCASTAAGPAFEAGTIRMGMRAATGAIAHVAFRDGCRHIDVIGGVEPRGICGSGLVDAVAVGLRRGEVLASGRISGSTKILPVAERVVLYQSDIRELQLAKGAIAAGFRLLIKRLGADRDEIRSIYLAGAFGNYVRVESAVRIGLVEAPQAFIHAAGNTALHGAKMLLLSSQEPVLPPVEHVILAADQDFESEFTCCMAFPEEAGASQSRFAREENITRAGISKLSCA